jgi:hypothetical protein
LISGMAMFPLLLRVSRAVPEFGDSRYSHVRLRFAPSEPNVAGTR